LIPLIGLIIGSSAIGAAEPVPAGGLHKYTPTAEELREAYQRSQKSGQARLYKAQITPNWFQNDTRFWYRNELRGGAKEFIVVEAERGIRKAAFDHHKLAAALSKAAGMQYREERLPFDSIEFVDNAKAIRFKIGETAWKCDLASYESSQIAGAPSPA